MSNVRLPVLIRRNADRKIYKIIVADLEIDLMRLMNEGERASLLMDGTIAAQALKSALNRVIEENNITGLTPKDRHTWKVKNFNEFSDKWIEVAIKNKKSCNRQYVIPSILTIGFLGAVGVAEFLSYYVNQVNEVSKPVATADIATDILANLIPFILSNLAQNTAYVTNAICKKQIQSRGYSLDEDFILEPKKFLSTELKGTLGVTIPYLGLIGFNNYVNTWQSYTMMLRLYEDAYAQDLVPVLSHDQFIQLAKSSFWVDVVFEFLVQLSGAATVSNAIIKFVSSFKETQKDEEDIEISEDKKQNESVTIVVEEVKETKEATPVAVPEEKQRRCFDRFFNRSNKAYTDPLLGTTIQAEVERKLNPKRHYGCVIM